MIPIYEAFKKWLGMGVSAPPETASVLPDRPEDFKYLDQLGLFKHATKSGYFCGRCKKLLKVHRDGWLCGACGQLHRAPIDGGSTPRNR